MHTKETDAQSLGFEDKRCDQDLNLCLLGSKGRTLGSTSEPSPGTTRLPGYYQQLPPNQLQEARSPSLGKCCWTRLGHRGLCSTPCSDRT